MTSLTPSESAVRESAQAEPSRRSFLHLPTLAGGALLATAATAEAARPAPAKKTKVAASAVRRGGQRGRVPDLYANWASLRFQEIRIHENGHAALLASILGPMARPRPTFQNLERATQVDVANQARIFENNNGSRGVLSAAPAVFDVRILGTAVSLNQVEGRHAGFLNTLLNQPVTLDDVSFEPTITQEELRAQNLPFIASLNGGPPLEFSMTPSPENDIAILNFFLALEYLESEFYNINVPRLFPGPVNF